MVICVGSIQETNRAAAGVGNGDGVGDVAAACVSVRQTMSLFGNGEDDGLGIFGNSVGKDGDLIVDGAAACDRDGSRCREVAILYGGAVGSNLKHQVEVPRTWYER